MVCKIGEAREDSGKFGFVQIYVRYNKRSLLDYCSHEAREMEFPLLM